MDISEELVLIRNIELKGIIKISKLKDLIMVWVFFMFFMILYFIC